LDSQALSWGVTAGCAGEISPCPFAERLSARVEFVARPEARLAEASFLIRIYFFHYNEPEKKHNINSARAHGKRISTSASLIPFEKKPALPGEK
jgi:hypothetical protein